MHPHLGDWLRSTNKCFPRPPPGGASGSIGGRVRWALGIDLGPSLPRPGAREFSCPRCIIGPSGAKSGAKWELSDGRVTVGVGGGSTDPGHSGLTHPHRLYKWWNSFSCTIPHPSFAYNHHVTKRWKCRLHYIQKIKRTDFQKGCLTTDILTPPRTTLAEVFTTQEARKPRFAPSTSSTPGSRHSSICSQTRKHLLILPSGLSSSQSVWPS